MSGDAGEEARRPVANASAWPQWALLIFFGFLAFECVLLAVVLQGGWWILLGPGAFCGYKAGEMWWDMKKGRGR